MAKLLGQASRDTGIFQGKEAGGIEGRAKLEQQGWYRLWSGVLLLFAVSFALLLQLDQPAAADVVIGSSGSTAGQTLTPRGVAVSQTTGEVYVADTGNRRIDVFDGSGEFLRAFGWGVVADGPGHESRNEIQRVSVSASGGTFALLFIQNGVQTKGLIKQETAQVPFDAGAEDVEAALEALGAFAPEDVEVSGSSGGPWEVEFTGAYADMDVHELEPDGSKLAGAPSSATAETLQPGARYEVCVPSGGDACRSGQRGTLAGQLNPAAVAVDSTGERIYVFDGLESSSHNEEPNNRVQVFKPDGTFLYMLGGEVNQTTNANLCTQASGDVCGRGKKGTSAGWFDRSLSSLVVGSTGVLYVNDGGRVQKFDSAGSFTGQLPVAGSSQMLAVDLGGDIYTADVITLYKYDSSGTLLKEIASSNTNALFVDSEDNLLVSSNVSGAFGVSRYHPDLTQASVFYSERGKAASSLARHAMDADVYAIESGLFEGDAGALEIPFPPSGGPVVYSESKTVFAGPIGNVKATLHSEVNPEGKATTFHFEVLDQESFEEDGWASPSVISTAESGIGSDFKLHSATQQVTGLTPETDYRFRVIASNADAPAGNAGPEGTFKAEPPVALGSTWATDVGTDSAALHGEANPLGIAATGYFEYVEEASYEASGFATAAKAPAGTPINFGPGESFVEGSVIASGLEPDATYHYRLVAQDNCKPAEPSIVCTFTSGERTLATFPAVAISPTECPNADFRIDEGAYLTDCRAYEMVSPVDKNGFSLKAPPNTTGFPTELNQSAVDGSRITYSGMNSMAKPKASPFVSQYLTTRTADGWQTEAISPPRQGPSLLPLFGLDYQFKAFTADLCYGWPMTQTALPLFAAEAIPGYPNLYRRDNCDPGSDSYEAVTRVEPPILTPGTFLIALQGFSADGGKAFYNVKDKLTPDADEEVPQLYEAEGDQLRLVCILPNGTPNEGGCAAGTFAGSESRVGNVTHAISDDGSRVFWTGFGNSAGPGKLYVRIEGKKTVRLTEEVARFWTAASDGSRAIYTAGGNLFSFEVSTQTETLIAGGVSGVAGASLDGKRIYFVSNEDLDGGATAGKSNLYLWDDGTTRFIATLDTTDGPGGISSFSAIPVLRTSRVTPSGDQLIFMSKAHLTGYDNADAVSGIPAAEVFLYDATAGGGEGEVLCLSCNPSQARPATGTISMPLGGNLLVAAAIPVWANQLYAPRAITDDGSRIFFNSFDRLVARDTNGEQDVYQWEAPNSGDCEPGGHAYVESAGGCISLVSSGESDEGSELVDSSVTGDDVFFRTYSSLLSQDPGLIDIYDARVDGGFASPPIPPEECEGEGCLQSSRPLPVDPTPASTVPGSGNQSDPFVKPKKCPKAKHRAKRKGRVVCIKNKAKGSRASRRASR